MHISVAGRKIDLPDGLRARVAVHLDTLAATYFDIPLEASVTFGRARSFFTCDIDLEAGRGLLIRGEGEASDAHGAFDDAAEHIARRLRRYRRRMGIHARSLADRLRPEIGRDVVLRPADAAREGQAAAEASVYATIVGEQQTRIPTLNVGEAVMQLDLADRPVLMFRNSESHEINVVYRRHDGDVGWLDPDVPPP